MQKVSMVWPLPPIKWGISDYCKALVSSMEKLVEVEFFAYDAMYPNILYPWGNYKEMSLQKPILDNSTMYEFINRYNPFSWIRTWMSITWDVLHIQYWIWFLSPIILTINIIARYIKKIPVVITVHNVKPHETKRSKLKLNKRLLFTIADNCISYIKIYLDKLAYISATWYIVHSQKNKEDLIGLIWDTKPIEVIPMGILPISVTKISKAEARKQLHITNNKKVLLSVGNIRPYKWLWVTLEILNELVKHDQEYILVIAGKCREDRSIYQQHIDQLWIQDHILRMPWFLTENEMNQVFCASDVQLLTYTHFDAQSAALATGLDFDIPMIVSDLGWLTDVIQEKEYIIDIQDIWSSAQKIHTVIDTLEKSILYVQQRKKEFSWETISQNTMQYYSTLF